MPRRLHKYAAGLITSDVRFIRVTVAILLLAFTLIIGLNSTQSFVEQHRVETTESFGTLLQATAQVGASSQRLALITFAALNPPEEQQKKKLLTEGKEELRLIIAALGLVSNTLERGKLEGLSNKTYEQILNFQTKTTDFVKLSYDLRDETLGQPERVKIVGFFANQSSELLADSRLVINSLSSDSVKIAQANHTFRRNIFFASSAAIILTATIVLFFIVHRLRLELQRRRQVEGRLLKTNEELENFSSMVAHDLKGPLNNIALSVQMLRGESARDPESEKKLFNIILKETDRLRRMIEALLRLSRLGTKKIDFQPFNIRELLDETKRGFRAKLEETKGKIDYHGVSLAWGDRALIGNVFQNLIDNSIKYRNGCEPRITIKGANSRDKTIFIYNDNGLGISAEKRNSVFDPFVQANIHSDGVGLGLSVVKKIITAHGGTVQIVDKAEPGTCFEFFIARKI